MKKFFLLSLLATLVTANATSGDLIINENFDSPQGVANIQVQASAKVLKQGGFNNKGVLKVVGNGDINQYGALSESIAVIPENEYGFSCNFKTEGNMPSSSIVIMVFFEDKNKKPVTEQRIILQESAKWEFMSSVIKAPVNARSMKIGLRLVQLPITATVYFSNIKLADLSINKDFFLTDFNTHFEPVTWNGNLKLFEHFAFGSGGKILDDPGQANVGEACFMANGSNEGMQYPFWIYKIKVLPNRSYVFEVDYKTTNGISTNDRAMIMFIYRDAENKIIPSGIPYLFVAGSQEKWKTTKMVMISPEGSCFLDICLNLRNIPPNDKIYIDNIHFYSEGTRSFLKYSIDSKNKKLKASCSATSDIKLEDVKSSSIVISKDNVEKYRLTPPFNEEVEIDISGWEDDEYSIFSMIEAKSGKEVKSDIQTFNVFNKTPWLNNGIGILPESALPPQPWSKISFADNSVSTWNNKITFSDNLQLKSINYHKDGFELLSSPMQLLVNGKNVFAEKLETPAKSDAMPSKVVSSAYIKCDGFDLEIDTDTDYTGFVKYNLSLKATRDIEINEAKILLSVNGAEFITQADGGWANSEAFDLGKNETWKASRFYHTIWIGGMNHGLCWFGEKLYPAVENASRDWASADNSGRLTLDMINEPLKLAANQEYSITFGVGITPNRPSKELWKTIRFRGGEVSNLENLWAMADYFKHYGFPKASGKEAIKLQEFIKSDQQLKMFYQCPTYIASNLSQWSFFKDVWTAQPHDRYIDIEGLGYDLTKGNYKEQTWTDLYLQNFVEFLSTFKFDGVYYDCVGCGPFIEGKDYTYPLFSLRKFLQRIYIAQHQLNPNTLTVTHASGNAFLLAGTYSDIILMGEQYRQGCFENDYYLEFKTLKAFRAENAIKVGADRMFMFQYQQADKQERPDIALHAMGLVTCHNLMVYAGYVNKQIVDRVRDLRFTFGLTDAEFFPYWEKNSYGIQTDNPAVICSFYKNSKGFLLCLLNSTNKEQSFTIKTGELGIQNPQIIMYEPISDKKSSITLEATILLKPYMATFVQIVK